MIWIGLTGNIGTGKSTAATILRKRGIPVLDADQVGRHVMVPGQKAYSEIVQKFGTDILDKEQWIDRKKLAQLVFNDSDLLLALEKIVHPEIQKEVLKQKLELIEDGHSLALYDVPLLFEKNMESLFTSTLVIAADPAIQFERIAKRDKMSVEEIRARTAHQLPIEEKISRSKYVIYNNSTIEKLEEALDQWLVLVFTDSF